MGGAAGTGATGPGGSSGAGPGGSPGVGGSTGPGDASFPDVKFVYDAAGGTGGLSGDGACANTSVQGTLELAPADIIIAVDNSGSMGAEAGFVQANMNSFSNQIIASGIDVHVVLISSYPGNGNGICIAPPLGGGGCPTADNNLPVFRHVNNSVGSSNGLQVILNTFPQWSASLRPNAQRHVVIVTDDNSSLGATSFDTQLKALDPGFANYKFHAIYSFTDPDIFTCITGGDVCCGLSDGEGTVYRALVGLTMGVEGNLCQQNFAPVFNQLATSVVNNSPLQCDIPMPTTDAGIINPDDVQIELTLPPAGPQILNNVGSAGGCGGGGWFYDNPTSPSQISLCPETCTAANAVSNPSVTVLLGCLGS